MILEETDALLFIDKPAGLLVHNSAWAGPREHTLVDEVRALRGDGWHPLHRLDRQTSGVIVFAREPSLWTIEDKRYWAIVRGHVREEGRVEHPIEGREATSVVRPLAVSAIERCSLVEVDLLSGRHHQARRHLKHIPHPVLGDATHGKGALNRDYRARYGLHRMALHARSVRVAERAVVAPLPPDLTAVCAALGLA